MLQKSDFANTAPGNIIITSEGFCTFVPAPIPLELPLTRRTELLASDAWYALGNLRGVGELLPNPHLLIAPFLRREAILSTRIEGTIGTYEGLVVFESASPSERTAPNYQEIMNYVEALEHGLGALKNLPVCLRLIRNLHSILMKNVRGGDKRPGEFRVDQRAIGVEGLPASEARFFPPPPQEMAGPLDNFEKYIAQASTDERTTHPLVSLALIHYQFEAIHPFNDGNGRIGRLLIPLILAEWDRLTKPLLYLSAYFDKYRDAYCDLLRNVSLRGAWEPWIEFFLTGICEQADDAIGRAKELLGLREEYRQRLHSKRSSALLQQLVDELFVTPALSINDVASRLGITYPPAKKHVLSLVDADILREMTGKKRDKIYLALDIVRVLEPS